MLLAAAEVPLVEIPRPQEDPQRAEEAARFIVENVYRKSNPSPERLAEQLVDMRSRTTLAAFEGGMIIGTGSLEIGLPHQARLDDIAVLDEEGYRRIGLGSRIVSRLEAMAAERRAYEITFVSAATSLGFYQKLGYVIDKSSQMCLKNLLEAPALPMD